MTKKINVPSTKKATLRNRTGRAVMVLGLKIAEPWYRKMIMGSIHYGLSASIRDGEEGLAAPEHWLTKMDALEEKKTP